jgi:hypothetical protein
MPEPEASSIYMSGDTTRMAREIEEITGVKASRLFRDFVLKYRRAIHPTIGASVDSLAFVLPAMSPWDVNAPRPFLGKQPNDSNSKFDLWQNAFDPAYPKAFKVFLMGKSLEHPVTNHKQMWREFVEAGGVMEVLLQGDMSYGSETTPQLYATTDLALNDSKNVAKNKTLDFLNELGANSGGAVEVRNTGPLLLVMNAGLIFREDGTVDIHLEFGFAETLGFRASTITMLANHNPPDELYGLVVGAMEELWLRSIAEPSFEHSR